MAEADVPATKSLTRLRASAADCRACHLHENATRTVFGAGTRNATIMLVGEQPGDLEDREGEPFVGPAGRLLDRALLEAGVDRSRLYVTNAVKHFKFRRQSGGKRRIHAKPDAAELAACRPWLHAEMAAVRPEMIVILGATAAATLLGPGFRVTAQRGRLLRWDEVAKKSPLQRTTTTDKPTWLPPAETIIVPTVHPSSVLRSRERDQAYAAFVRDLRAVGDVENP